MSSSILPPPPTGSPPGSYAWQDWYFRLNQYLTTNGTILWANINKAGSNLTDLATRNHNDLQGIQGGTSGQYNHLTDAQLAALGSTYVNSFNTRTGAVTLTSGDVTTALTYTPANLISPSFTTPTLGAATATSINFGGTTLNRYNEGTWTPSDQSGAGLALTVASALYTRIGRAVHFQVRVTYPATASGASAVLGTLPFVAGAQDYVVSIYPNTGTAISGFIAGSGTTMIFQNMVGGAAITNADLSGATLRITGTYFV